MDIGLSKNGITNRKKKKKRNYIANRYLAHLSPNLPNTICIFSFLPLKIPQSFFFSLHLLPPRPSSCRVKVDHAMKMKDKIK